MSERRKSHQRQRKRLDSLRDTENPLNDISPRQHGRPSEEFDFPEQNENSDERPTSNIPDPFDEDEDLDSREPSSLKPNRSASTKPSQYKQTQDNNRIPQQYPNTEKPLNKNYKDPEQPEVFVDEEENQHQNIKYNDSRNAPRTNDMRGSVPDCDSEGFKMRKLIEDRQKLFMQHQSSRSHPRYKKPNPQCAKSDNGTTYSITIENPKCHGAGSKRIEVTVPIQCKSIKPSKRNKSCHTQCQDQKCVPKSTRRENNTKPECIDPYQHIEVAVNDQACHENAFPFIQNPNGNLEIEPNMVIFQNNTFAIIVANRNNTSLGVQDSFWKPGQDCDCDDEDFHGPSPKDNDRNTHHQHFQRNHGHKNHTSKSNDQRYNSGGGTRRNRKPPHLPPRDQITFGDDVEYYSEAAVDSHEVENVKVGHMSWSKEQIDSAKLIQARVRGWMQRKRYMKQRDSAINSGDWDKQLNNSNHETLNINLQPVKKLTLRNTEAIIIFGGCNPGKKFSASNNGREIFQYNLRTNEWSNGLGIMPEARTHFGAVYLSEIGSILVFGGSDLNRMSTMDQDHPVSTTWKLDINTGLWKILSDMNVPRSRFGYAIFRNKVYVFGGLGANEKILNSCEMYDPKMETWSLVGSMLIPRVSMGVAKVDDTICISGGQTSDREEPVTPNVTIFHPNTRSFTNVKDLPQPRFSHTLVQHETKVFALGGVVKRNIGDSNMSIGTDICKFEDRKWKNVSNLKIKRHDHCQVKIDQYAILIGGITYPATEASSTVEMVNLDKSISSSIKIKPMPKPLCGHVGIVLPAV